MEGFWWLSAIAKGFSMTPLTADAEVALQLQVLFDLKFAVDS